MWLTKRKHQAEMAAALRAKDEKNAELERQLEALKIGSHDIIEAARNTLVDVAGLLRGKDAAAGETLHGLAESLPYVLSGCHPWPNRHSLATVPDGREPAEQIAKKYGIALPTEKPELSVIILLEIASVLMAPDCASNLAYYRGMYRVQPE